MINNSGSASFINPKTTKSTRPIGNIISDTTTFETPHAALTANKRSFPKIKNIITVKSKVHMSIFSPFHRLLSHEMWFY